MNVLMALALVLLGAVACWCALHEWQNPSTHRWILPTLYAVIITAFISAVVVVG
jgi:hypothetical protein